MRDVFEIMEELEARRSDYQGIANTADAETLREAHLKVKALQKELADTISDGANPCPSCGAKPHGMPQSNDRGALFEVGCTSCGWFRMVRADDQNEKGLIAGRMQEVARDHGAQGSMPRHAVEAWNAGPRFWKMKERSKFTDEAWEKLPKVKQAQAKEPA